MKVEEFQFPSDWKLGPVSEVFDFTGKPRGLDLSKNGDEIPFFPMEQIPIGRIHVSQFTKKPLANLGSGTYVENGDLMVAKITPSFENGKQAIVDIDTDFAYATTEVIPMRGRKGESDTLFLFFYLLHPEVRSDLAGKMEGSTGRQRLSKTVLGNRLIPLPPLPEQKKIAHILSTVQRAIEMQERIIQTITELKKALMHKLFTEGLRNEPQKETEIGFVPESWEVVELGTLAKVGNGSTPKRANEAYWEGGSIPWLNSTKIHDRFITEADQFVTPQAIKECHLPKVTPNSLLIAITGQGKTLGNSAITRIETCINQHLAYAQFQSGRVVPDFVLWYMQTRYEYLRSIAHGGGSTKGALTCGFLKTLPIPVPPTDEQKEIVTVFQALEDKHSSVSSKQSALKHLFRTLLHEMMTAKTRVHQLEVTA
jgi:type I restriction enzyme S subunit